MIFCLTYTKKYLNKLYQVCSFHMESWSSGLIKLYACLLVLNISIEYFKENFCEYYCLNIPASINSLRASNMAVNTNHKQLLSSKLQLIGEGMKFLPKKLLCHKIFSSLVPWATKYFLKISKTLRLHLLHTECTLPYDLRKSLKIS